jgi:hypothetical protein
MVAAARLEFLRSGDSPSNFVNSHTSSQIDAHLNLNFILLEFEFEFLLIESTPSNLLLRSPQYKA